MYACAVLQSKACLALKVFFYCCHNKMTMLCQNYYSANDVNAIDASKGSKGQTRTIQKRCENNLRNCFGNVSCQQIESKGKTFTFVRIISFCKRIQNVVRKTFYSSRNILVSAIQSCSLCLLFGFYVQYKIKLSLQGQQSCFWQQT